MDVFRESEAGGGRLVVVVISFFCFIFTVIASGLKTFFDNTIKWQGEEDFMAGCSDDNYTISWSGPSGPLTTETKPQVEVSPHGTLLHFRKSTEKDSGNYTCSTAVDSRVVSVIIRGKDLCAIRT